MEIRKEFKFEMGHIVRKAWSRRCSKNAHGHSYICEVFFKGDTLDNGQMLIDFGVMKQYLNDMIDSFDHAFWLWDISEDKHVIEFFTKEFERVIVTPWSSSAESQAMMFYHFADATLRWLYKTNNLTNGEGPDIVVSRVIVHETKTGKAEYNIDDFKLEKNKIDISQTKFSEQIQNEWKFPEIVKEILYGKNNE